MDMNIPQDPALRDADRITRAYFDALLIETRYIDSVVPSTAFDFFGETFATPIMTTALSHLGRLREDGDLEFARGARAAEAVCWIGMSDDAVIEAVAATGARFVEIVKPFEDHDEVVRKLRHAEACGAIGVGMDIDHVFNGRGRTGEVHGLRMGVVTQEDLARYAKATRLPFLVKGVLGATDAAKCAEAGAAGILASHHHGIQPYAVPPLLVLPEILAAVERRLPVYVDCAVQSGFDAYKAMALGAAGVCVGRAIMDPLKEKGAEGVRERLAQMTDELAATMARTGAKDVRSLDPGTIRRRDF